MRTLILVPIALCFALTAAAESPPKFDARKPINLIGREFTDHKFALYHWMLEEAPVCMGKISLMKVHLVSRYEDCRNILGDPRFLRNRGRARTGPVTA